MDKFDCGLMTFAILWMMAMVFVPTLGAIIAVCVFLYMLLFHVFNRSPVP